MPRSYEVQKVYDATGKFILVAIEIVRNLSCSHMHATNALSRWTLDTRSQPLTLCPVVLWVPTSERSFCIIMGRQSATPARHGRKRGPRSQEIWRAAV